MPPGYLHFDLRQGCTARALAAAMASLPGQAWSQDLIKKNQSYFETKLTDSSLELSQLVKLILGSPLKVQAIAIASKILELLAKSGLKTKLSSDEARVLLDDLISLVLLTTELDPKYISATKITVSANSCQDSFLNNDRLIQELLIGLPIFEQEQSCEIDPVGLAYIKTVTGRFGARGNTLVLALGSSQSREELAKKACGGGVQALWCEAELPDTIVELGPSNQPKLKALSEIRALVPAHHDIAQIIAQLSLHRARDLSYHLVHTERGASAYLVQFVVSSEYQREAIEAFLIKAGAKSLRVNAVEHHELTKRIVSTQLGSGNKISSARFVEYLYLDKIIRVEPVQEDLDFYASKNQTSIDVARSDLLSNWKRWRGCAVEGA